MITLACHPVSKQGFVIQVEQSADNNCDIKGCKLPQDIDPEISQLNALLAEIENSQRLQSQEFQNIKRRISEINITPNETAKRSENMVHYTMWIKNNNNDVLLKWKAEPPSSWTGVSALVSTLLGLLNKYLPKIVT